VFVKLRRATDKVRIKSYLCDLRLKTVVS